MPKHASPVPYLVGLGGIVGIVGLAWWVRGPSPNFTWAELSTTSQPIPNPIPSAVKPAYSRLVWSVLEPLRSMFGPLQINSGYRSPAVNSAIGGSSTSSHMAGPGEAAADVQPISAGYTSYDLGRYLLDNLQDFPALDQAIVYTDRSHLHVGISPTPRGQFLEHTAGSYTTWRG